jgi:malate synthase
MENIKEYQGENYALGKYEEAAKLFDQLITSDDFVEFLTLPAYDKVD